MGNPRNLNLLERNHRLEQQLKAFENGNDRKRLIAKILFLERKIIAKDKKHDKAIHSLEFAHKKDLKNQRELYEMLAQEMDRDLAKEYTRVSTDLRKTTDRLYRTQDRFDDYKDTSREEIKDLKEEISELTAERDALKKKNEKLLLVASKNHENSNFSSSQSKFPTRVTNSRTPSGKKVGGQLGSFGHRRKQFKSTPIIQIETPEYLLDTNKYTPTGKVIKKQVVNIKFVVDAVEYRAEEFRELSTGKKVHGAFPDGIINEANYGESIQATAFMLNMHCNVSIAKTKEFISHITNGEIEVATGTICNLARQFNEKSQKEKNTIMSEMILSPVMNVDFTTARVNGKTHQILLTKAGNNALIFPVKSKGEMGIEGSPIDGYSGILCHDHERVFFKQGNGHQECLQHLLRYLKSSMENEDKLVWNRDMHCLVQEMIHYRNQHSGVELEKQDIALFEKRYDEILQCAKQEYEDNPPNVYYKEGMNTYLRLKNYKEWHLLFLHDHRVPTTNNDVERIARLIKRKLRQVTTFRSVGGLENTCTALSLITTARNKGKDPYKYAKEVFSL